MTFDKIRKDVPTSNENQRLSVSRGPLPMTRISDNHKINDGQEVVMALSKVNLLFVTE